MPHMDHQSRSVWFNALALARPGALDAEGETTSVELNVKPCQDGPAILKRQVDIEDATELVWKHICYYVCDSFKREVEYLHFCFQLLCLLRVGQLISQLPQTQALITPFWSIQGTADSSLRKNRNT